MTEEQIALAHRAVACKGFRWVPGMLALPCSFDRTGSRGVHVRVVNVYGSDGLAVWGDISGVQGSWEEWRWREEGRLPDLTDVATLGCLLALVREAWSIDDIGASRFNGGWCVEAMPEDKQHHAFYGYSEVEALVAALEAAP